MALAHAAVIALAATAAAAEPPCTGANKQKSATPLPALPAALHLPLNCCCACCCLLLLLLALLLLALTLALADMAAADRHRALYLQYTITPTLEEQPATDISVEHIYNSTSKLKAYGKNGIFASQPIHTAYFTSNGRFLHRCFSTKTAAFWVILAEKSGQNHVELAAMARAGTSDPR